MRPGNSVFSRVRQLFSFGRSSSSLKKASKPMGEVVRRGTLREVEFKVTAWESDSEESDFEGSERVEDSDAEDNNNRV